MNDVTNNPVNPRDSSTVSLWQKHVIETGISAAAFTEQTVYDVLIVGGGITGLTAAYLLQSAGKQCVVAEASSIGYGTTGGTTAHLNTFFDATYADIEKDFGEDAAKLVAQSGKDAFALITGLVERLAINCDLEYKEGFLFSANEKETKELNEILKASQKAGINAGKSSANHVPIPFKEAIVFHGQGQFHPLKYISHLAKEFINLGGIILENTPIKNTSFKDNVHHAESQSSNIKAKNLVYATHIPPGINILDFRCAPYRSYVLGVQLNDGQYPAGLVYDMQDPYHYFRTHVIDDQKYLIIGGEDHKTGHDDPEKAFTQLESYAHQYFNISSVDYRWSAQYYIPADGLPYIGTLPLGDTNTYVATGYNGNGMIFGSLAAKIIADQICGIDNPYSELYKPSRIKPVAGFPDFVKENADVAYHFIADRFSADAIGSLHDLQPETGKIIKYEGHQLAVYKDESGNINALNPVCTHAKCIVNFNAAEKSWDCPCHGGRFGIDGKVLTGPPRNNLEKVSID